MKYSNQQDIDIKTFEGTIPLDHDLVIYEKDGDPLSGYVLNGFDEVDQFSIYFDNPQYCFINLNRERLI